MTTVHSLVGNNPSGREIKDLDYAVAHTETGDVFIIIEHDKKRHPVSEMRVKENMISWVNDLGVIETIGLEFPLPDRAIEMATTSKLFVSEMDAKKKELGEFVFSIRPDRLVSLDR